MSALAWVLLAVLYALALLFVWSLCAAARRGDEQAERAYRAELERRKTK